MLETSELADDRWKRRRDYGRIERGEKHRQHETAERDQDLAMSEWGWSGRVHEARVSQNPVSNRWSCGRTLSQQKIADASKDSGNERQANQSRRPVSGETKRGVERVSPETDEC